MTQQLLSRDRAFSFIFTLLLLLFPFLAGPYWISQIGKFLIFAILALSLDLIWGYTGVLNLGHAIFFGLGAYVMALVLKELPPGYQYLGLIAAVLLPALAGLIIGGLLFYRNISGPYFAIVTLAIALVAVQVSIEWYTVTDGFNGLTGIPMLKLVLPTLEPIRLGRTGMFYLIGAVLLVAYYLTTRLVASPFGRLLVAIRDNEARTEFFGYNTACYKTLVFGLAGGLAGLSGALYAPYTGFVSPELLGFIFSTEILIWVAVGGRGTLLGPALGAVFINVVATSLSDLFLYYWQGIIGLLFVLIVLFFPDGLFMWIVRRLRLREDGVLPQLIARSSTSIQEQPVPKASSPSLLDVSDLSKKFGDLTIINQLDFKLASGELRCVVGPNGAGKTTLFSLISGGLSASSGEVHFAGQSITRLKAWQIAALGIGRKFQIPNVYDTQPVWANLAIAAQPDKQNFLRLLRSESTIILSPLILELLEQIKLLDRLTTPAAQLSHGERQWLEICMLLASRPQLLLLDEPTAGLTVDETQRTAQLIHQIYEAEQLPIIVIEHDIGFVRRMVGEITVLHRGQVLAEGPLSEIEANPEVQSVYLGRAI